MINSFICYVFGHKSGGYKERYNYPLYTYIHCKRCKEIYMSYPTAPDFIEKQ